jgi:hypothetical protein
VGFEKALPGFVQHLHAKCSALPLLTGVEHCQSLEIALTNVGHHYLKVVKVKKGKVVPVLN